jgi:hypothetical protein
VTWARIVGAALVVAILGGCSYLGADATPSSEVQSPAQSVATSASPDSTSSEATATVSIGPSSDPTPTASLATPAATDPATPPPTPCCMTTPSPSPSFAAGLAASDRFWKHWFEECFFGAFHIASSLEEITSQSDLVIRGKITDLYSRVLGGIWHVAYVKVLVTEVLKGEPASAEAGTVEVQVGFASSDLDDLRSSLPAHDQLWFLTQDEGRDTYNTTDYPQVSVLRDIGGIVRVIQPEWIAGAYSRRHFPVPLDGTSFEELVAQVRRLVERPPAAMHTYLRRPGGEPEPNRFAAC